MSKRRTAGMTNVKAKLRWSESDARIAVTAWRRSGKGVSEFARQYGLSSQRLLRWSARLQAPSAGTGFHPVRVVGFKQGGESCPIEVVLLDGRRVRVREGFSSEELGRVLEVLEGRG